MTDYNTPGGIGHNSGEAFSLDRLNDIAKDAIDEALAKLKPRYDQLMDSAKRAHATDRESAGKVTDLVGMFASLEGHLNRAHSEAKAPYLEAGRVVDGRAAEWRDEMSEERKRLNGLVTAYQQAEAKRIADLRAAERRAEAADPEPSMADNAEVDRKVSTLRGDYGASARLQDVLVIDKVAVKKLPKRFLERPKILAVIEAEAKVLIRAGEPVTGVTSRTEKQSRVRKGG